MKHDVFLSHAAEDKVDLVRPLVQALAALGLLVWYDEDMIRGGDSIREAIDRGLRDTRNAVVVLSPAFLRKRWTKWELNALVQRFNRSESRQRGLLIPIWHRVSKEQIQRFSPAVVDIAALQSTEGVETIALRIRDLVLPRSRATATTSRGPIKVDGRKLDACARAFLGFLREFLRSDALSISVYVLDNRADRVRVVYSSSGEDTASYKIPSDSGRPEGLTAWVAKTGTRIEAATNQSMTGPSNRFVLRESLRSMIAVPIMVGQGARPVGVFYINSTEVGVFERERDSLMNAFVPMATAVFRALITSRTGNQDG